jgi:hypothetical protein
MINNIHGNSNWLNVQTYPGNKPYFNTTQPATGTLRYNPNLNSGCMEVYDGNGWQQIANASANVDLSEHTKEILTWAEKKMSEERELKELMEQHPGLQELHDKLEMMKILCQQEENNK